MNITRLVGIRGLRWPDIRAAESDFLPVKLGERWGKE